MVAKTNPETIIPASPLVSLDTRVRGSRIAGDCGETPYLGVGADTFLPISFVHLLFSSLSSLLPETCEREGMIVVPSFVQKGNNYFFLSLLTETKGEG